MIKLTNKENKLNIESNGITLNSNSFLTSSLNKGISLCCDKLYLGLSSSDITVSNYNVVECSNNKININTNRLTLNSYVQMPSVVNPPDKHTAKAMVLTCIDFRFIDDIVNDMISLGYLDSYDQFILAGASLGYNTGLNQDDANNTYSTTLVPNPNDPSSNSWGILFEKHIDIAKDVHNIQEIIIIDHYDCKAFKLFYGLSGTNSDTYNYHIFNLSNCVRKLKSKYNSLFTYKVLICDLQNNIINVTNDLIP